MNDFYSYLLFIIYAYILVVVLIFIFGSKFKNYHSRWDTLIDNFKTSPKDFYQLLKKEIYANGIKNVQMSNVYLKQGNMFSANRLYLRIEWREYQYDICASPVGKGFFVSYWLLFKNSTIQIIVSRIPFIGSWLVSKLFPVTYYSYDTASMFLKYCHLSVLKVIDTITKENGLRSLNEEERKPIMNDIFKR